MEEDDSAGESGDSDDWENSDESDEEDNDDEVPIPASWNQDFSSAMTVNDGHDSAWQYHQNHMVKGAIYPDKQHLQDAITSWAMSTQRVFKTKVSSQKYLTVVCKVVGCPARVHGYTPKNDTNWVVSDFVSHTCVNEAIPQDHGNLSSPMLARLFYTEIVGNQAMKVKSLIEKIQVRTKYKISYGKAWRAKQRALENRFGSFLDAYDCVVLLLHTLQAWNPGTYVDIQHFYLQIPQL